MIKKMIAVLIIVLMANSNVCIGATCCNEMPNCPMKNCEGQNMSLFAKVEQAVKVSAPTLNLKTDRQFLAPATRVECQNYFKDALMYDLFVSSSPPLFIKDLVLLI